MPRQNIARILHAGRTLEHRLDEYHTDKWDWFDEGKWSYSNGIITITDNNESELIKVKTLTDSQLIIETTDKYTEDGIFYEDYELTEYRKI